MTEVIEVGHGHAIRYLGNYDDYLAKKAAEEAAAIAANNAAARAAASAAAAGRPLLAPAPAMAPPPPTVPPQATAGARPTADVPLAASTRRRRPPPVKPGRTVPPPTRTKSSSAATASGGPADARRSRAISGARKPNAPPLASEMNDPNFYLPRNDAKEMIAAYELLGREIEKLYEDLVGLDGAGAPSGS